MGILTKLFGAVPETERGGIRLEEPNPWKVSPTNEVERFLRALPLLVPDDSIAYFEGTAEPHVAEYLREVSIPARVQVAIGTIWPRPDRYHVPLTTKTMEDLAAFLDENPAGYFCTHCHVYRNGVVLLAWHDAFAGDPLYVSRGVVTTALDSFTEALGTTYREAAG